MSNAALGLEVLSLQTLLEPELEMRPEVYALYACSLSSCDYLVRLGREG